jgi:hypothetical protein
LPPQDWREQRTLIAIEHLCDFRSFAAGRQQSIEYDQRALSHRGTRVAFLFEREVHGLSIVRGLAAR